MRNTSFTTGARAPGHACKPHRRHGRLGAGLTVLLCLTAVSARAASPQVTVRGGEPYLQENINAHVTLDQESCQLPAWRERVIRRSVRQSAREALRALGYYHPELRFDFIQEKACWRLEIELSPGAPVRVRRFDVTLTGAAKDDPAFRELLAEPPLAPGDILRHDRYESFKRNLVRMAAERGYFDASLTQHELVVNVQANTADIALTLQSGNRYHFGEAAFNQQVITENLAQRFVPFQEGDPYENEELLTLRQELSRSGYFSEIRINTDPDKERLRVPVTVDAEPRPRYSFLAGLGFATDTGPRLRLGLENRRVNHHGHSYHADTEVSAISTGAGFNYRIPLTDPNREYLNLSSSYIRDETETSFSERYRLGVARVSELDSGWIMTRSLELLREFFTVGQQDGRTDLLMPGLEMQRTAADDPLVPRRGWHLYGKLRFAGEQLGSTTTFTQFRGRAKAVIPVPGGRLLGRVDLGATDVDAISDLPASVRFFAGGDNSVRGYGFEELGPEDSNGDVIGGRHLLTGSLEYDYPVFGQWSLAAFMDAGNAFNEYENFDAARGAGAGIRWRSPIGPVRLDVARALDTGSYRLHISMGADL